MKKLSNITYCRSWRWSNCIVLLSLLVASCYDPVPENSSTASTTDAANSGISGGATAEGTTTSVLPSTGTTSLTSSTGSGTTQSGETSSGATGSGETESSSTDSGSTGSVTTDTSTTDGGETGSTTTGNSETSSTESDSGETDDAETGTTPCEIQGDQLQTMLESSLQLDPQLAGGISLSTITPRCRQWSGAVGFSHGDEVLSPDHYFRMGTLTELYVATAMLKLVSGHAVDIDETIEQYGFGLKNDERITLKHVLRHHSGIYSYNHHKNFMDAHTSDPDLSVAPEEILGVINMHEEVVQPNTIWMHSWSNYIVAGLILRNQGGVSSAAEIIRKWALTPAALEETYLDGAEEARGTLAQGWTTSSGLDVDATNYVHPSLWFTAGGMVATARDLARFVHVLFDKNTLLTVIEMNKIVENPVDIVPEKESFGLGVKIHHLGKKGKAYGRCNSLPGYSACVYYYESIDSTVAVMANHDGRLSTIEDVVKKTETLLF